MNFYRTISSKKRTTQRNQNRGSNALDLGRRRAERSPWRDVSPTRPRPRPRSLPAAAGALSIPYPPSSNVIDFAFPLSSLSTPLPPRFPPGFRPLPFRFHPAFHPLSCRFLPRAKSQPPPPPQLIPGLAHVPWA